MHRVLACFCLLAFACFLFAFVSCRGKNKIKYNKYPSPMYSITQPGTALCHVHRLSSGLNCMTTGSIQTDGRRMPQHCKKWTLTVPSDQKMARRPDIFAEDRRDKTKKKTTAQQQTRTDRPMRTASTTRRTKEYFNAEEKERSKRRKQRGRRTRRVSRSKGKDVN